MELQNTTIKVRNMIETLIKRTIKPTYKVTSNPQVSLYLEQKLKELPRVFGLVEMDDERIVDYIVYQIYRTREDIERGGNWNLTWIFSDYAKAKYKAQFLKENSRTGINYYIDKWLDEAELDRGKLKRMISPPKENPLKKLIYLISEEPVKRRFLNTEAGLGLCVSSTTGFTPLSPTCKVCENTDKCKEITERNFPELLRLRLQYGN